MYSCRRYIGFFVILLSTAVSVSLKAQTAWTAEAWITQAGGAQQLSSQAMQSGSAANQCVTLNTGVTYQTIDGFGWTLTEASAKLLMGLGAASRTAVLNELYNTETGLGVSIVRVAIGACDLSEYSYTYSASEDAALTNFSVAGPDLTYVIPVLQEIRQINPDVKILATPWTAPVWMKENTNGNNGYKGGNLKTACYSVYAQYFVKYLDIMQSCGLPVWALSIQNEPLNGGNNPSMTWTKETERTFIDNHLGPAMKSAGYDNVLIIGYDHNCDNTEFPLYVARSKYVCGSAFHLYGGNISTLTFVHNQSGKDVFFTEQYTDVNGNAQGDFDWHIRNVMLGSVNNWSRCALEWNLASNPDCSIHTTGGSNTSKGALTINGNNLQSRNVSYWIVSTMSRVVRTNAQRIASSGASDFLSAAFRNADGSLAVVAYNTSGGSRQFSVSNNGNVATWQVPANAVISVLMTQDEPEDTALQALYDNSASADDTHSYNVLGQLVGNDCRGVIIKKGVKCRIIPN